MNELFFMFMARHPQRWRFILIARRELVSIRGAFEAADRAGKPGRRPAVDPDDRADALALKIEWGDTDARGWGVSFGAYLDCWPDAFPENADGPGAVKPVRR